MANFDNGIYLFITDCYFQIVQGVRGLLADFDLTMGLSGRSWLKELGAGCLKRANTVAKL